MKSVNKSLGIFFLIALVVVLLSIFYIILPVFNVNFFFTNLIFSILLITILYGLNLIFNSKIINGVIVVISIIMIVLLFSRGFLSTPLMNSEKYRSLIGSVEEKDFSTEITPIDLSQIPVVDKSLAENLADKKLGEQVALGSQVTLGQCTIQNVDGKLYWVAPLLHSGIFKWMDNKTGTPGYLKISATNQNDIELIQEVEGEKVFVRYQPNAYFSDDLHRHIYMSGYKTVGLTDYSFELDDSGKPYWVVTKYNNSIHFGGKKVDGVLIVDAMNGNIEEFSTEDIPEWVDRVYPADIVIKNQLTDWGKYVHGFMNSVFAKKDIIVPTWGYNVVFNNDGCYYYTGMTSAGADESTVGFMLIDTKTKKTTMYKVSGSNEGAAMQSAEGQVQNLGYESTFPILINIDGEATYFMPLKDKKGLVKLYAMVNVADYSVVGVGESLSKTKSNYIKKLRNRGDWQGINNASDVVELEGTIQRIHSAIVDDTTYYYILINEQPNKIFIGGLNISNELPITQVGDIIFIQYYENENSTIDLIYFDNKNINISLSKEEKELMKENEAISKE